MNTAFKQSQQALNSIQRKVKERLEEIQYLDKECAELDFNLEKMREEYFADLIAENDRESSRIVNESIKIEDIAKLEEELKERSLKKIKLAEEIQTIVNQSADEIQKQICETAEQFLGRHNLDYEIRSQHMFQSGLRKQKGRQKNVNPEIKAIIKEYYNEKDSEKTVLEQALKKYCLCKSQTKLQHPESMIECENFHCKTGWYHFQCVGLSLGSVPHHWYCSKCHSEETKNLNTLSYKLDDQKVEMQLKKEQTVEEDHPMQVKRKRGRPRKYPVTHQ